MKRLFSRTFHNTGQRTFIGPTVTTVSAVRDSTRSTRLVHRLSSIVSVSNQQTHGKETTAIVSTATAPLVSTQGLLSGASLTVSAATPPMPITYLNKEQAQQIDVDLMNEEECGFSIDQLMELAGLSVACAVHTRYGVSTRTPLGTGTRASAGASANTKCVATDISSDTDDNDANDTTTTANDHNNKNGYNKNETNKNKNKNNDNDYKDDTDINTYTDTSTNTNTHTHTNTSADTITPAAPATASSCRQTRVLVLCGPGNNGGDGLVAARHLHHFGCSPTVCYPAFTARKVKKQLFHSLVRQCQQLGIKMVDLCAMTDASDRRGGDGGTNGDAENDDGLNGDAELKGVVSDNEGRGVQEGTDGDDRVNGSSIEGCSSNEGDAKDTMSEMSSLQQQQQQQQQQQEKEEAAVIAYFNSFDVIIDSIFGFSFDATRKVRPPYAILIKGMLGTAAPIASVDIPSGWDVVRGPYVQTQPPPSQEWERYQQQQQQQQQQRQQQQQQQQRNSDALVPVSSFIQPEMLISLTAPKLCARHFQGQYHYLGGRFVPPYIRDKYQLELPAYKGREQCVQIG